LSITAFVSYFKIFLHISLSDFSIDQLIKNLIQILMYELARLLGVAYLLGRSEYIEYLSITLYITFTTKFYSNADLYQVRLNNNDLAEIYQNGKWIPICGHWFWNNNKGATLFCQQLGYTIGIVKQESIARQVPLPDDGFRIGECETNDIWGQCTGGCNDHTIGGTHCSDCRSGAMAGLRIECSNGNGNGNLGKLHCKFLPHENYGHRALWGTCRPSSIYSCFLSHIWEHEFCHLGCWAVIRQ
jgi:hypothetical protein